MNLVPIDIADRMVVLARREALWRGVLMGVIAGAGLAVLLIRGLLT
jgi:hypothetical protein